MKLNYKLKEAILPSQKALSNYPININHNRIKKLLKISAKILRELTRSNIEIIILEMDKYYLKDVMKIKNK